MRVAVLIKQVPLTEQVRFADGRLVREGVELEVNPYCRRANAKAVELAGPDGEVVVFTMAPPAGDDALREMIACGASRGVHLCDPAFAGSDTLATARALARAIQLEGPFDLVLAGLNSVDADTGQVGPEVAELLGLPFAAGVRQLALAEGGFRAQLEEDTGHRTVEGPLPAVLSAAERLCDPSKAPPPDRAEVAAERIRVVTAAALGLEPNEVGTAGSPTVVGPVSAHVVSRRGLMAASAAEAVRLLDELGAFEGPEVEWTESVPEAGPGRRAEQGPDTGPDIWCFLEPGVDAEHTLLGEAAVVAAQIGGRVTAVAPEPVPEGLGGRGADTVLAIPDANEPEQWSQALSQELAGRSGELPWAVLLPASRAGRTVAATVAARLGWGLTGDAIALEVSPEGRLVALKPAFGGQLIAAIHSRSPVQLVSVRPGVLDRRRPRVAVEPEPTVLPSPPAARVVTVEREVTDPDPLVLVQATAVLGVGLGVPPERYAELEPLQRALGGAPLAATRKVTDRGWLPRSRQVGITGHAISPRLYVAIGVSGRLNHTVGLRGAGLILAVDQDPSAAIFSSCDVGVVGDWAELVPALAAELSHRRPPP